MELDVRKITKTKEMFPIWKQLKGVKKVFLYYDYYYTISEHVFRKKCKI